MLQQLAARGVRIGIDDFGTGQSSLAHLNDLPVHTLKIDRSLIEGLGRRPEDSAIVSAIVGLGHALDFTVTAEGIEDDMQLHTLRTLGCDLGQGYYFARPAARSDRAGARAPPVPVERARQRLITRRSTVPGSFGSGVAPGPAGCSRRRSRCRDRRSR